MGIVWVPLPIFGGPMSLGVPYSIPLKICRRFRKTQRNPTGQISIIPKPELRGFLGDSLTKPPFKVTSAEVVIICPESNLPGSAPNEHVMDCLQSLSSDPRVFRVMRVGSGVEPCRTRKK